MTALPPRGQRKFVFALVALILSGVLVATAGLEGAHYRDIVIGITGLFAGANAAEHFANRDK